MAEWKKEIARLASDLFISREEVLVVLKKIENMYSGKTIPSYYKGNQNEFLYDKAQREIINLICA